MVVNTFRYMVEWQFIEESIGLSGWFSVCTLGGSFSVGVFGLCDFKPSAIVSGRLRFALNMSIVSLIVLACWHVGSCVSFL